MKNTKKFNVLTLSLILSTSIMSANIFADNKKSKIYYVKGEVTTGYNISKGKIMYDLGGVIGEEGFNYVFAYEPTGSEASVITEYTDENRLVATGIDQAFYDAIGVNSSLIDRNVVNLPFRDLPITIDGLTAARTKLGNINSENYKNSFTLSAPSEPITIRDWYDAKGWSYIKCFSPKSARAIFRFSNLVPNGVYAVWGIFGDDKDGDGLRDFFAPLPFGGAPNVMTANGRGFASFDRQLPFCPNTDKDMMTVEITYHVDGVTYGAVPSLSPLVSNGNSYLSTPTQITFNIGGLTRAKNN